MQSEAAKRASAKYDKENTTQYILKLNKKTDADIIEYCTNLIRLGGSRQGFMKIAIRELIKKVKEAPIYMSQSAVGICSIFNEADIRSHLNSELIGLTVEYVHDENEIHVYANKTETLEEYRYSKSLERWVKA